MLSGHSFNALLKTLEEPPPHVKFLLATTDPHKIPVTVLSRCLQFNLKRLLPMQIATQMAFILQQEQLEFEEPALKLLSCAADGSMRDGLSLLDQAIVFGNGKVSCDAVSTLLGTVAQQPVEDILMALAASDAPAMLDKINEIASLTPDFADVLQQMLQVFHRIALVQQIPSAIIQDFDAEMIAALASKLLPEDVQLYYQIGLLGQKDLDLAPDPRSGFEMVMLRMLTFRPAKSLPSKIVKPAPSQQVIAKPQVTHQQNASNPAAVKETLVASVSTTTADKPAEPAQAAYKHSVDNNWADMIALMSLAARTLELANNCVLESIDNNTCTLIVDPGYMRTARSEESLQKALQAYQGAPLKLIFKAKKPTVDTPAVQLVKQKEDRQQSAVDSISSDENIKALKENFDARVMPGSIEPI
jgi:DNA polymerase-3 subunit gamma/tau